MEIIGSNLRMQAVAKRYREEGRKIAFVPTMGYLHDGHLSLVRKAKQMGEIVVVSIFVNPLQFGPKEDFSAYPRDTVRDCDALKEIGVDIVFIPKAEDIYPEDYSTHVEETVLSKLLCGASRPGHFKGVVTIVTKLFNIVQPTFAVFGQKDYQQALIIRRIVRDLNLPVEIVVSPIVREIDGLALSSRNSYLSEEERSTAPLIYQGLKEVVEKVESGETSVKNLETSLLEFYRSEPKFTIDYVAFVDPKTLQPVEKVEGEILVAVALYLGSTRLIDNVLIGPGESS